MSLLGRRLILSVLIVGLTGSVGFLTFNTIKDHSIFCEYDDPVACQFLAGVRKGYLSKSHGTYLEVHKGESVYVVDWKLSGNDQEVIYKDNVEEQMHVLMIDEKVYLKDYTDGRWWEQSREQTQEYETQLPFEPHIFISNLQSDIESRENRIYFIQKDICGDESCRKYAMSVKGPDEKKVILFLSEKDKYVKKVQIEKEDIVQEIMFEYDEVKILKPEINIKIASKSENIFLQNVLERSQTTKKTPGYVQEFEESRIESEIDGSSLSAPVYEDSSPTESSTSSFIKN